jgi:hypothetical protein
VFGAAQAEYDAGSGTCVKETFICATLVGTKRVLPPAEGEAEQVSVHFAQTAWWTMRVALAVVACEKGMPYGAAMWACWSAEYENALPSILFHHHVITDFRYLLPCSQRPRIEVLRSGAEPIVPRAGDIVTARVVRINPRLAAGEAWQWGGGQRLLRWFETAVGWKPGTLLQLAHRQQLIAALPRPAVDILCVGPRPVRQRYSGVIRLQDVRATEVDKVGRPPCGRMPAMGHAVWPHHHALAGHCPPMCSPLVCICGPTHL